MFPVRCHGCGQTGKVASIPADLVCVACKSSDVDLDDRTAAIMGDPTAPMGNLPTGVPVQDQPMANLPEGEQKVLNETVRCSTCFHQFSQRVTDPTAPMLACPKCGADTVTAAGTTTATRKQADLTGIRNLLAQYNGRSVSVTYSDDLGLHTVGGMLTYHPPQVIVGKSSTTDADVLAVSSSEMYLDDIGNDLSAPVMAAHQAAADARKPSEIAEQNALEVKPAAQLTGDETVDLSRLRQEQGGTPISTPGVTGNPYSGGNPYKAKIDRIAAAVLDSNPGMERRTALRVARQTLARYPKVTG